MHCSSIFALLAVALRVVSGAPYSTNGTNTTYTAPTLPDGPTKEYYLVTQVIGEGNKDKDGLYVSGYHTGAGFNDVTLGSIDVASKGFLNGTYQQYDYSTEYPWSMQMGSDINYAAWEFVMIDVGDGSEGFYFNDFGLQWNETEGGFNGWLACDWWHGLPQLFWNYAYYDYDIPSSCANVNLVAEGF